MNKPLFHIGQTVFNCCDEIQEPRIITGVVNRPNNVFTYMVGYKDGENECYDIELSKEMKSL